MLHYTILYLDIGLLSCTISIKQKPKTKQHKKNQKKRKQKKTLG